MLSCRGLASASYSVRRGTAVLARPQRRSIWASFEKTHQPKQPFPVHPKVKMAGSVVGWIMYGAIGYGIYNAYVSYAKKQQRLSECVEMPKQEGIKVVLICWY